MHCRLDVPLFLLRLPGRTQMFQQLPGLRLFRREGDQLLCIANGIVAPPDIPIDGCECLEDLAILRMAAVRCFQNGEGLWGFIG